MPDRARQPKTLRSSSTSPPGGESPWTYLRARVGAARWQVAVAPGITSLDLPAVRGTRDLTHGPTTRSRRLVDELRRRSGLVFAYGREPDVHDRSRREAVTPAPESLGPTGSLVGARPNCGCEA
jgi:hypothetical protein